MSEFKLYRNPNPESARRYPYLLDLQSDSVARLATRVVAPVAKVADLGYAPITRLMPQIEILGDVCVVVIQELAAIERSLLRESMFELKGNREQFVQALDLLFTGI